MREEELISILDQQVARLSHADRTAVLLRFYERQSLKQVGETLGISEEAAKKRVQRAVEKLRMRMAGQHIPVRAEVLGAILLEKLVQPAPAKLAGVILAHASPQAEAVVTAGQSNISGKLAIKVTSSGKAVLATSGAVLATALVAAGITVALARHGHPKIPDKLIISRSTTYITHPLAKDGLPDYKLAIKQYLMRGVTPDNNAAVPAIELAMQGFREAGGGPKIHYRKMGTYQLKLLGAAPPKKPIPRIDFIDQFFRKHPPQGYKLPNPRMIGFAGPDYSVMEQLEEGYALDFPWRESRCFDLWAAMLQEKAATEMMRTASLLPRFYVPSVYDPKRFKGLIAWFMPTGFIVGGAGECMCYRATLDLGRGHLGKCRNNLLAATRLAMLAYQQPDNVGGSVGNTLFRKLLYAYRTLLGQLRDHPRKLAQVWKTIHAIRVPPPLRPQCIHVSRLEALKLLLSCYRHRLTPPMQPLVQTLSKQRMPENIVQHPPTGIHWNWQFYHLNETFDELAAMAPQPPYSPAGRRLKALTPSWVSAGHYIGVLGGWNPGTVGNIPKSLKRLLSEKLPVNVRYHNMILLATGALDAWPAYTHDVMRSLMLVKIAYALEVYHITHDTYPGSLVALSPAFFNHPPVDPVTGRFPMYNRQGNGYDLAESKGNLRSHGVPRIPYFGPQCIVMPPPAPTGWQKGPFP
jgi:hypothetical protein